MFYYRDFGKYSDNFPYNTSYNRKNNRSGIIDPSQVMMPDLFLYWNSDVRPYENTTVLFYSISLEHKDQKCRSIPTMKLRVAGASGTMQGNEGTLILTEL